MPAPSNKGRHVFFMLIPWLPGSGINVGTDYESGIIYAIFMKRWQLGLVLIYIFLLSGCGFLSRIRQTHHHGIESHDFDLPVITYNSADSSSKKLMLFFSGDGGWLDFDDQLASGFAAEGFETIGFNSRTYFWTGRTPRQTADDVMQLISKYSALYKTNRIYLCGYSFGADIVPFIYNRLVPSMKNKVVAVTLLSPFASTDFMIHTSDLLNIGGDDKPYKVRPEVEAIKIPVFCFYGEREHPRPLDSIQRRNFSLRLLPGDHHYDSAAYPDILSAMQGLRRNLLFRPYRLRKL